MADEIQDNDGPATHSYFLVEFADQGPVRFEGIGDAEAEHEGLEYRHGNSPVFYPIKMPGLGKVGNVTMRKGIFVGDAKFWTWYDEIKMNTIDHGAVVIQPLDENGAPLMTWTLNNAWPTKISDTAVQSEGNEVAVESVEIAYETLVISAP